PPPEIFKAYDIRGVVGRTLTPAYVEAIGQAIGSEVLARGGKKVAVGYDGRLSGPELAAALARGIPASGAGGIEVGRGTPPMGYFAGHQLPVYSGGAVTRSQHPPEYN